MPRRDEKYKVFGRERDQLAPAIASHEVLKVIALRYQGS
jgi:hypothetical protein